MNNTLGKQLKVRRIVDGVRAQDVAKAAGISLVTLYQYEQGRCNPSVKILTRLARALGTTEAELLSKSLTLNLE